MSLTSRGICRRVRGQSIMSGTPLIPGCGEGTIYHILQAYKESSREHSLMSGTPLIPGCGKKEAGQA